MTETRNSSRIVALVAAAVLAVGGLAAGAAGGVLFGVFGSDGTVASGSHRISTSQAALVTSVADIDDISDVAKVVGDPRLRLTARGAGEVFIGVGTAEQVDRYLASAPIDEVTDFEIDPFVVERKPRGGTRKPEPPASQGFWVASGSGSDRATLRWKIRDGDYRLVLMNADGSRNVDVRASVGMTLPHVAGLAWGLVIGGALLLAAAIAVIALALRRSWAASAARAR